MSFIQVETSFDRKGSNAFGKHRRVLAPVAVVLGTALVGLVFLSGLRHFETISVHDPMSTAIALRPDYPVSTFLYDKRGFFDWFVSTSAGIVAGALAFAGVGFSCVVVSGGTLVAGCVVAAVAAGFTVASSVATGIQGRRLRLAQQSMIYMGYEDRSSGKRSLDAHAEFEAEHREFLDSIFGKGSNYKFENHITMDDTHNAHLVLKNGGAPVPVFSFTTEDGIPLHHAMIANKEGGNFHRFGFNPEPHAKRDQSVASTHEYFKQDGIDILDCWADDTNKNDHLNNNNLDNKEMQQQITCNTPNFNKATELAAQIYDATTQETIAAGRIAPFGPHGDSVLLDKQYSSCPTGLTDPQKCPREKQTY